MTRDTILPVKNSTRSRHHVKVEQIVDQVRENPAHAFTVEQLAKSAGFSQFHFHRLFKALTGETVANCIQRLRLEAAAGSLVYTPDKTLTHIALDCGFSSSSSFAKAFRAYHGCSPSQYRRDQRGGPKNSRIGQVRAQKPFYPEPKSEEVTILFHPVRRLAGLRLVGSFTHERIGASYRKLACWYEATFGQPVPDEAISLIRSDTALAQEETWRLDTCFAVPEGTLGSGDVMTQTLEAGWAACLSVVLPVQQMDRLSAYWDWFLGQWWVQSGTELADRPDYEIYRASDAEDVFNITLCLPLKQRPRLI